MNRLGEPPAVEAKPFIEALSIIAQEDQFGDPLLFRGQSDSSWPLCPSLFRSPQEGVLPLAKRRTQLDRLSRYLDDFMEEYIKFRNLASKRPSASYNEKMAIGQHYGLPTPLLDWTDSALVALFMAVAFWDGKSLSVRVFAIARDQFTLVNGAVLLEAPREGYRQTTQRGELSYCVERVREGPKKGRFSPRIMDEIVNGELYFRGEVRYMDILMNSAEFERGRYFFSRNRLSFAELFPDSLYWAVHQIKMRHLT